jgi:hypothetical protein
MTFKELSKIIAKKKDQFQEQPISNPEQEQAKAFLDQRREHYLKAYKRRIDNWLATHPDKEYVEESYEESIKNCEFDEWYWYLIERLQDSPEQRYQQEKNKIYGFGHDGIDGGADSRECLPGCRFYPEEGRIEDLEVLEDYRQYQRYEELYNIWLEIAKANTKEK